MKRRKKTPYLIEALGHEGKWVRPREITAESRREAAESYVYEYFVDHAIRQTEPQVNEYVDLCIRIDRRVVWVIGADCQVLFPLRHRNADPEDYSELAVDDE